LYYTTYNPLPKPHPITSLSHYNNPPKTPTPATNPPNIAISPISLLPAPLFPVALGVLVVNAVVLGATVVEFALAVIVGRVRPVLEVRRLAA
jgi:hypothetical protein